jgi:hypothetical protein
MSPAITAEGLRALFVYDPETGVFAVRTRTSPQRTVGMPVGSATSHGYVQIGIGSRASLRMYRAHRLAWLYMTGSWPQREIDHINGDRADNRWANLREVSTSVNAQNARRPRTRNKSGLLGVFPKREKFAAQICIEGKKVSLGSYATAQEAHAAYIAAKRRLHPGCTI